MVPPGVIIAGIGEEVTFECQASLSGGSADVQVDYTVFHPPFPVGEVENSELLVMTDIRDNGMSIVRFRITSMEAQKSGRYICEVPSTGETVSAVLVSPMALANPNGIFVAQPGDTVTLTCLASNYTSLEASFARDASFSNFWPVTSSYRRRRRSVRTTRNVNTDELNLYTSITKVMDNVGQADMGRYVCQSTNTEDMNAKDTVDLIVLEAQSSGDVYPEVGDTVILNCWVKEVRQSQQRVNWYFSDTWLNKEKGYYYDLDQDDVFDIMIFGQTLSILNVTKSRSGTYTCKVAITIEDQDYWASPKYLFVDVHGGPAGPVSAHPALTDLSANSISAPPDTSAATMSTWDVWISSIQIGVIWYFSPTNVFVTSL
ncbi:uncharacterized protein LOC100366752 [Saccoglossus kowalevskii]|uniref:Uncharacterized protein LOC100366752 n=1 Tax=Saccoglossus kowalevskii TaxID=10224 RepID=A0ABM0GNT9_SACKO|nr:PREDICTED: uncharacterized protein LOC100366752 [Saccoglossus kowalevskii]